MSGSCDVRFQPCPIVEALHLSVSFGRIAAIAVGASGVSDRPEPAIRYRRLAELEGVAWSYFHVNEMIQ